MIENFAIIAIILGLFSIPFMAFQTLTHDKKESKSA